MRTLAIAAAVAVVAVGVLLGVATRSLNRVIANDRDRILQRVTAAVGREVAVQRIRVTLWGGLGIRLEDVRVADDPRFSDQDLMRAAAVTGHVKLLPLLRDDIEVSRVDLVDPQIQLIRNAAGEWNYAGLVPREPVPNGTRSGGAPAVERAANRPPEMPPLPAALFLLGSASIRNGSVAVTDATQRAVPPMHATQLDLVVSDIGELTPIGFSLEAAVERDAPNVHLEGRVGPLRQRDAIPFEIGGAVGPVGDHDLQVDALHIKGVITADGVHAAQLDGRAFGGTLALSAQVSRVEGGRLMLKGQANDIRLAEVAKLQTDDSAQRVHGAAQVNVDLHATGDTLEALTRSVAGSVDVDVDHGTIEGLNIAGEALRRLSGVPGLGNILSERVKPKYARILNAPDTHFETLRAQFRIADEGADAHEITIVATDFGLHASGRIRFDRQADLVGTLTLSKQFSRDVVSDLKEAALLANDDGQLTIPFRLHGKLGKARPTPDTEALLALMGRDVGGNAAGLLNQLLGGKRRHQQSEGGSSVSPLERDLRKLFGH